MRCEEVEHDIAEYLAGTLPPESLLLEHLAECQRCRNEVGALKETWADLANLQVPPSAPVMNPSLLMTLKAVNAEKYIGRSRMTYLAKPVLLVMVTLITAFFAGRSLLQPTHEPAVVAGHPAGNAAESHYRGDSNAPATLLEYGDYECPPCGTFNPVIKEVLQRYAGKIKLEFRQFPLAGVHPNAVKAALAAEAAGDQSHYWEMNDLLFETQPQWSKAANPDEALMALAGRLGLDQNRFVEAFHSPELQRRISDDVASAQAARVRGTPTFFLNGHLLNVPGATLEIFMQAIESELQQGK